MLRIVSELLHPLAQLRHMHVQVLRRLNIRHASILDQAHRLKLELSRKLTPLHDPPPAPSKHLTRCLRNQVQASRPNLPRCHTQLSSRLSPFFGAKSTSFSGQGRSVKGQTRTLNCDVCLSSERRRGGARRNVGSGRQQIKLKAFRSDFLSLAYSEGPAVSDASTRVRGFSLTVGSAM